MSSEFKQDLEYYIILAALLLWPIVAFAYINIMEHYEANNENSENITISESNNNHSQSLTFPER